MQKEQKEKLLAYANGAEAFIGHNGVHVTDVDDNYARVELTLHPEVLNRWQAPHGGILFTMGDVAAGVAVLTVRPESCVTVNASIDFMEAVGSSGTLVATGRVLRCGGRLCYCEAKIETAAGKLLTTFHSTMYFTGGTLPL
ncbi:MAG: PaaI family thioesterase [Clostridiales bacterium]|nr:PaaI family thioesterase [Clostridiales bacterium]